MRIAVVAPLFAPLATAQAYGPHAFLLDLAAELQRRGHDVTVYCADGSSVPGLQLVHVPVEAAARLARVMPGGGPPPAIDAMRAAFERCFSEVRRRGADAITQHAFDAEAIELADGLPTLHTLHLPPVVPRIVSAARATTAALATVSEACRREWLGAGVPVVRTLRNGVPDWDPGRPAVRRVALLAGRISPEKGVAAGIRAARVAGLTPLVVGEIYDAAYHAAEVAPLLRSGEYLPTLPRRDLWRTMATATVTLMPVGWDEPFGLVAAEAQVSGCPVVGYRRGALPEVVEEGASGYLVAPGDEAALAAAIGAAAQLDRAAVRASALARLGLMPAVDAYERTFREIAATSR